MLITESRLRRRGRRRLRIEEMDRKRLKQAVGRVWGYKMGQMVSLQIHLADRLELFKSLAGCHGFVTTGQLAVRTGLHPRWLMELLRGLTAAGILEYREGDDASEAFRIGPEMVEVLANESSSLLFAGGAFAGGVDPVLADKIVEAFHTGLGYSYKSVGQRLGEASTAQTKRLLGVWTKLALVDQVLAAMDGGRITQTLRNGGRLLDMGCGAGVAANCIAAAFPQSTVHAVDPDHVALQVARKDALEQGSQNVTFIEALGEQYAPPTDELYDMAVCLDIIHDCPRPDLILARVRQLLKPGGTLLIKDIKSLGSFPQNLAKIPTLAMTYGFSISMCLSSSLSQPDGMGLGTLGFNPVVAREMCAAAGFEDFIQHDFKDPANLYYEMRAPGQLKNGAGVRMNATAAPVVDLSHLPGPAFCACGAMHALDHTVSDAEHRVLCHTNSNL